MFKSQLPVFTPNQRDGKVVSYQSGSSNKEVYMAAKRLIKKSRHNKRVVVFA